MMPFSSAEVPEVIVAVLDLVERIAILLRGLLESRSQDSNSSKVLRCGSNPSFPGDRWNLLNYEIDPYTLSGQMR